MALLFFDGFDYLPTQASMDYTESGYAWTNETGTTAASQYVGCGSVTTFYGVGKSYTQPSGGNSDSAHGTASLAPGGMSCKLNPKSPATTYTDVIIGFRWLPASNFVTKEVLRLTSATFVGNSTSGLTVTLGVDSTGHFVLTNAAGTTLGVDTHVINSQWQYIELRVKSSATTQVTLKRNGVTVINASGVTITNPNMLVMTLTRISGESAQVDDLYIVDNSDSTGFLGNVRVPLLLPSADTAQKDLTPNSGSNNYDRVNSIVQDTDTTYISSTTAGHKDIYDLSDISGFTPNGILGVQFSAVAKNTSPPADIRQFIKTGGTEYPSAGTNTQPITSAYAGYLGQVYPQNPNTAAAWSLSEVNALQLGIENVT